MQEKDNGIEYEKLDPEVIPMVRYFNENGLTTWMSCQGHNRTNMSMFWISFHPSVTKEDIIRFCYQHKTEYGCPFLNGRFVLRLTPHASGRVEERYEYMAATVEAASQDLQRWKNNIAWSPEQLKKYCAAQPDCGEKCPNAGVIGCQYVRELLNLRRNL